MNAKTSPVEKLESKSTLYEKLTPEQRRKLNRAIVDRAQPTYRACYEHFHLADQQIGFYAFYRYARNLRRQAAVTDLADAKGPEGMTPHATDPVQLNEAITCLLAYRLIEAADDETADSHELLRLARAYNLSIRSQKTILDNADRVVDKRCAEREKDADDLLKVAKAITKIRGEGIKQQVADFELARTIPDPQDECQDQPRVDPRNQPPRRSAAPEQDGCLNQEHAGNPAEAPNDPEDEPRRGSAAPQVGRGGATDNTPRDAHDQPPIKPPHPIKQIQDAWAARNAENLARAKPGSVHEAIARIYANPQSIELDP